MQFLTASYIQTFGTFLFKMCYQLADRLSLMTRIAIEAVEHLLESPLRPVVISRIAGTHFAVPVERETNLVQLLTIAGDISRSSDRRMLSRLNGILFGRQAVCIVSHRIQHIESLQTLVACINVTGNVSQRMTYVKTGSRRIREHVQHIELLFGFIFDNLIGLSVHPSLLPFFFNFSEIIFHIEILYN